MTIQAAAGGSPKATVACGNQNPKLLTVLVSRMLWWVFWSLQWAFGGPQKATVACGNQKSKKIARITNPDCTVRFLFRICSIPSCRPGPRVEPRPNRRTAISTPLSMVQIKWSPSLGVRVRSPFLDAWLCDPALGPAPAPHALPALAFGGIPWKSRETTGKQGKTRENKGTQGEMTRKAL